MKNFLKKYFSLPLLLVALFALSACGDKTPSLNDRIGGSDSSLRESYEGVVEAAAVSAHAQGTHRIISEEGSYLIQSSTIDLNSYIDKEVMVSGFPAKIMGRAEPVLNVDEVHLTKISFQAPFISYQSERYDFTLEYPETWELNETESGVVIRFDKQPWVNINRYSNQERLETFVPTQEKTDGVQVTVAHQRAIRFNDASSFRLYVENPSKQQIYLIRFDQKQFSDPEKQPLFYTLLKSFEFVYSSAVVQGEKCGGAEKLICPEDFRCELANASIEAEGVCVPLSGGPSAGACPFISPPTDCPEYRVAEYNSNGCPFRYECLEAGLAVFDSIELDPNPTEEALKEGDDEEEKLEPETSPEEEQEEPTQSADEKEYTVPPVSSVTGEYTTKSGLSLKYPKSWYFYNFGAEGIGFAPKELESIEDAVMVLKVGSGGLTREVDGKTYGMSGPEDLKTVMQAVLDSVK